MAACRHQWVGLLMHLPPPPPPPPPATAGADVGAGYGLVTLAAAARGHRVHAFELGPASLEALEASLAHNGFEHLVQVGLALQGCVESIV